MPEKNEMTLRELADLVGGVVVGSAGKRVRAASTLSRAGDTDVTFLANAKYEKQLATTRAAAVVVGQHMDAPVPLIVVKDPYYAFQQMIVALHGHRTHKMIGISPRASVSDKASVGENCSIHDFATVSDGAVLGCNCVLYPGVFIGPDVRIGDDCVFHANACVYNDVVIGNRVIVNANATIGEDGFGYATHNGVHHKIPQVGIAIVEDDVEIGANCCIERGTLNDTVIGKGSKLGDMVAIGHGSVIGSYCLLVAQVGIAGSTEIGHHCTLGGQVGVVGHIRIGNNVTVAAQAGVINSVPDGQVVVGAPAIEIGRGRRAYSLIQYLPEMKQAIRRLEKQMERISGDRAASE